MVIKIDNFKEKYVSELMCVKCYCRRIVVYPKFTLLKDISCPNCGPGYMIMTGEEQIDIEKQDYK